MNRWTILGVAFFGALFSLFAFWRVEVIDSHAVKGIATAFLIGTYCAIVAFGTAGKKRSLSLIGQTLLGIALSVTIAALFDASGEGFALAIILGLVLGFTADKWVEYVQLP